MPSSPAKKRPQSNQSQITSASWQGPLPPPESVAHFDTIVNHGAERIFRMAEIEQKHRIDSESAIIQANVDAQRIEANAIKRGHYLGSAISLAATIAAVTSAYFGAHPTVSIALIGVPLMSAVRAIILRK